MKKILSEKDIDQFLTKLNKLIGDIYLTECNDCKNNAKIQFEVLGDFFKDQNNNSYSESENYFLSIKNKKKFKSKLDKIKKNLKFDQHKLIKICYICKCKKKNYLKTRIKSI